MTDAEFRQVLEARDELRKREQDSKINFYRPCCRPHKNLCPILPCKESKHTKFHESDKRIRIVFGGNRSGKSICGLIELLMMACFKTHPIRKTENPKEGKYRLFAPDFGIIEKMYLSKMKEWIPKDSLLGEGKTKEEKWENSYDKKYHILKLKGNVMIDFMSYDQAASKSESVELDGVMADEEMPEEIYSATLARLISRGGKFWMTVTPLYGLSWGMTFLDNIESIDNQVEVFNFSIFDNPYLSEKYVQDFVDSLESRPQEKEARLYGRFMELAGLVYKELRSDIHLLGEDMPKPGMPVIFALDPHPRKASVMTWAFLTRKGDVVFFDELEMKGTAKEIARVIRQKEILHKTPTLLRIIDPAAKAQGNNLAFETDTLKEFEKEGMGFTLADNSDAGYNVVHEYLVHDPARPLSIFNRPRCFFTKNVPKTWYGMTHLLWDEWTIKRQSRDEKERVKDYKKDFPDVVRYTLAIRPTYRSFMSIQETPIGNMNSFIQYENKKLVRDSILGKDRQLIISGGVQ